MFCGQCGNQMGDDASFCPKCGASTGSSAAVTPESNSAAPQYGGGTAPMQAQPGDFAAPQAVAGTAPMQAQPVPQPTSQPGSYSVPQAATDAQPQPTPQPGGYSVPPAVAGAAPIPPQPVPQPVSQPTSQPGGYGVPQAAAGTYSPPVMPGYSSAPKKKTGLFIGIGAGVLVVVAVICVFVFANPFASNDPGDSPASPPIESPAVDPAIGPSDGPADGPADGPGTGGGATETPEKKITSEELVTVIQGYWVWRDDPQNFVAFDINPAHNELVSFSGLFFSEGSDPSYVSNIVENGDNVFTVTFLLPANPIEGPGYNPEDLYFDYVIDVNDVSNGIIKIASQGSTPQTFDFLGRFDSVAEAADSFAEKYNYSH